MRKSVETPVERQQYYREAAHEAAQRGAVDLARRWWDLAESMAAAGAPGISVGSWSCVRVGPTGFRVPAAVETMLKAPSPAADRGRPRGGAASPAIGAGGPRGRDTSDRASRAYPLAELPETD
ncbi:MAG: hypothetical protein ACRDRY_22805 [Pseudonocardiaceae bacterium]